MTGLERRKLERFDLAVPTCLSAVDRQGEEIHLELLTENICAGGAYFKTDNKLPVGMRVELEMVLPKKQALGPQDRKALVKVVGNVIRLEANGMAICLHKRFSISSIPDDEL